MRGSIFRNLLNLLCDSLTAGFGVKLARAKQLFLDLFFLAWFLEIVAHLDKVRKAIDPIQKKPGV